MILKEPRLAFLGAAGTVTGSKYLIETSVSRILVDCGLFQGYKELRLRNWAPPPVDPTTLDAVILTHAHLDHSGYLPVLIRHGFRGPVYSTSATKDLCGILLPDSGHLQEADARFANRRGYSKHHPALPLYTQEEAEASLAYFKSVAFCARTEIAEGISMEFLPSGHILGSAFVKLYLGNMFLLFSGDIGRPHSPTMVDPQVVENADFLLIESTYGNRVHPSIDPEEKLTEVINRTAQRGGAVIIPSFAVGRSHTLLFHLSRLKGSRKIPDIPVYLDSPMAINAAKIYCDHLGEHRLTAKECHKACRVARYVKSAEESKAIDAKKGAIILLSASGMLEGGRILHHLKIFAPDPRNTILLTGFQPAGTRGAALLHGTKELKIHGEMVPVKAEIVSLDMLSAHADQHELLDWLSAFKKTPRMTFITHGEPEAAEGLRLAIQRKLNWPSLVPAHFQTAILDLSSEKGVLVGTE